VIDLSNGAKNGRNAGKKSNTVEKSVDGTKGEIPKLKIPNFNKPYLLIQQILYLVL